jgi:hypothetical protein
MWRSQTDDTRTAYTLALKAGAVSRDEPRDVMLDGTMAVCNAFVYALMVKSLSFFK